MALPVPFLPHRFRSAAPHYLSGRPPYPPRLIARVAALTGLRRRATPTGAATGASADTPAAGSAGTLAQAGPGTTGRSAAAATAGASATSGGRVLDLGCGPGQLALAFAAFASEVVAVDPEPEMLRVARDAAGAAPIRFLQASSYDLGPAFGQFRLAVMGRSFHWMDRADTLHRLDRLIEPGGAVALFGDVLPDLPDNAWRPAWRAVLARYRDPGNERQPHGADWVGHEAVLLDSAFNRLDRVAAIERRRIPVVTLVDRALSRSGSTPARLGDRVAALSEEIVLALHPFTTDGMITEVVESYALIATRRPAE